MPLLFLLIGALLVVSAINNTQKDLGKLVHSTFTGPNNFLFWVIALVFVGSLGYIKAIKPLANAFLGLIILSILLADAKRNGRNGFFAQFSQAFVNAGVPVSNTDKPDATLPAPSTKSGGGFMDMFKSLFSMSGANLSSGGSIFDGMDTTPIGQVDFGNTSFANANDGGSIFSGTDTSSINTVDYGSSLNLSGFGTNG